MSSDPEDRTSNDNKRPRMDLGPSPQVSTPLNPNQIQLKWKASEFVKTRERRPSYGGSNEEVYKTSEIKFNGFLWYVRIKPNTETIYEFDMDPRTLMVCELWARNETGQNRGFVGSYTVRTAYHHNRYDLNELRKSTHTGYFRTSYLDKRSDMHRCMLSWFEYGFPLKSYSDEDYMSITIDYLGQKMSDHEAKLTQIQSTLLDQMKKEVKRIDWLLILSHRDTPGTGDGDGIGPKEDFVIESNSGIEISFNKALLKFRGGDFFNGCLNSEMTESRTSHLKLENFDNDTILGFREYLYRGTLPHLDTNAVEYFKFGDFSGLEQIKSLAELELCKNIDEEEFMVQAVEIAQRYETKYMKDEIMDNYKKNPKLMEKLIQVNFDEIDHCKYLKDQIMELWKKNPELMEKFISTNFHGIDFSKLQKE